MLALKLYEQLKAEYPDETDQLEVCNQLMSKVCSGPTLSKLHAGGLAEHKACREIGLVWKKDSVQGPDAENALGQGVELKTYKRVQNANTININYKFPTRQKQERDEVYRERVVNYFMTSEKFIGGHYWVGFNQEKTEIYRWNFVPPETVANLVNEYLKRNPTSGSINFGGRLCATCKRCHKVDELSVLYLPRGTKKQICTASKKPLVKATVVPL